MLLSWQNASCRWLTHPGKLRYKTAAIANDSAPRFYMKQEPVVSADKPSQRLRNIGIAQFCRRKNPENRLPGKLPVQAGSCAKDWLVWYKFLRLTVCMECVATASKIRYGCTDIFKTVVYNDQAE